MISSKKDLDFYLKADRMINRGYFSTPFVKRINHLFCPDTIMNFLESMRCYSYYRRQNGLVNRIKASYFKLRFLNLSKRCGFSIDCDCFGYGLMLNHYGTIVVGGGVKIGSFSAIYTSTCIVQSSCVIGDFFFMGSGAVISKGVNLGNNVNVSANSVVNKSFDESDIVIAGQPASVRKRVEKNWIERYDNANEKWTERYSRIMNLKREMFNN